MIMLALTALCSSLLTALIFFLGYKLYLKKEIEADLDRLVVRAREEIRSGLLEAGRELLPELRTEVADGFKDAMSSAVKGEILSKSAQDVARTGSEIVENSLAMIFGLKKPQG
ncbi:MAG: hypothetical protein HS115_08190 [Spirochaetales bacterium]|nr:hypothetical protein [Spirochaetales bacterium]